MEMPWIALGAFIVLAIVFYYFWRSRNARTETPQMEDNVPQSFDFEAAEELTALVRRKTNIVAATQSVKGKRQKLRIELKPVPAVSELKPPPEKKIDLLLDVALNPAVYAAETGDEVSTFDPPLTVTIYYNQEDVKATTLSSNGAPQLSIVSAYPSPTGWRFEKLPTTVAPNPNGDGGTLTTQVTTLEPNDPFCIGKP